MKRLIAPLLIIFNANIAFAYITENVTGGCADSAMLLSAVFTINEYTCSAGYYLPANTDGCVACLYGHTCAGGTYTFDENTTQGIVISEYTCPAGYFLPADTLGCAPCPAGATCNGGTFTFNETMAQGVKYNAPITQNQTNMCTTNYTGFNALFTANTHTCAAGYYLPANTDGCTICPENSYCAGGTYTFNKTTAQGLTGTCPAGLYAPAGMWAANQCGHILHIGDEVVYLHGVKKTSPSLHVKIGNDIFYGNMTTADVVMHAGTAHKLKVQYDNMTYSIYDDTVNVSQ